MDHVSHHWIRLADVDLDLILTFDPEDGGDPAGLLTRYRRWAASVKDAVEDGLETA